MELRDALFAALRYELTGALPKNLSFDAIDEPFLTDLYAYSNRQEVAHLVGDALERLGVLSKFSDAAVEPFRRRQAVAAYHAEQQRQVFEAISAAFDAEKIPYLPLKGLVIRPLYPEPWMRTAGDLDILVKQEELERASELLTKIGARQEKKEEKHDRAFFFATGVMLELHFRLLEDERANGAKDALDEIWEHTELVAEERFEYRMQDAWFYYFHLVHAAKHLQEGTCGIRPFLDLWVLDHTLSLDLAERDALLNEHGLLSFAHEAQQLTEVWFSDKEQDDWSRALENFLLSGGTFGSKTTKYAMQTYEKRGFLRFYFSRIFLPFSVMKKREPILEKYPILFPFLQVKRWFRILFLERLRNQRALEKKVKQVDAGEHTVEELREHLGLARKDEVSE